MSDKDILQQAAETLDIEGCALEAAKHRLGADFVAACRMLLDMTGRAVVSGIGKSGSVGRKLVGTLASTGTPALFLHPAEAIHGDLGMVCDDDVVIMLSNSGESDELARILPYIRRRGVPIIAICGNEDSTLAAEADVIINSAVEREACPLGLAPTASTTTMMALGDSLAMAVMQARGFTTDEFARSHPGGSLGRRLLTRVADVMNSGDDNPTVGPDTTVLETLLKMTQASVRGVVSIVDENDKLLGMFTDGDLRRLMQTRDNRDALMEAPVSEVMTEDPTTIGPNELATEALHVMEVKEFDNLPVVDEDGTAVGIVDIQDLMKFRIL
ncbi:MAG: SIS domain-containing protein [Armatimonadota bacterium]